MKFLVDEASGLLKGGYETPLDFSLSGYYVVDVPTALGVVAASSSSSALATAKVNAFKAVHSSLPNSFNNEFLLAAAIDTALSTEYSVGPNKRVALGPGGVVQTPVLTSVAGFVKVFVHLSIFTLSYVPSTGALASPSRLLYNYDPGVPAFSDPALSNVTVDIMDSTGGTPMLVVTPGMEQDFTQSSGFQFRLRFTNASSTRRIWLSDYVVLYG